MENSPVQMRSGGWLHPWTGVTILGMDWALFGSNLLSGMALTPVIIVLGAIGGFVATWCIERRLAGRPHWRCGLAALLAAVVVGAPMPLGGTIVGGLVIAAAGLPKLSR